MFVITSREPGFSQLSKFGFVRTNVDLSAQRSIMNEEDKHTFMTSPAPDKLSPCVDTVFLCFACLLLSFSL